MNCRFDKEIIQRYIDNTIDPLEYIFLKEHLAYCSDCKNELELLTRIDKELGSFFNRDMDVSKLDMLADQLIEDCLKDIGQERTLLTGIKAGVEAGKEIINNSVKFVGYIPGSKLLAKGMSKAAGRLGTAAKSYVKNSVRKAFSSQNI